MATRYAARTENWIVGRTKKIAPVRFSGICYPQGNQLPFT